MIIKKIHIVAKALIVEQRSILDASDVVIAEEKFANNDCQMLSCSAEEFVFAVEGSLKNIKLTIVSEALKDGIVYHIMPPSEKWDTKSLASLMVMNELLKEESFDTIEHRKYSREGMIQRVLSERMSKAMTADYRIKWADNIYGDHILTNESGQKYTVFLRDFKTKTGYSNSKDAAINGLGTTKHIMYAFEQLRLKESVYKRLRKTFPFIEVFCDPLNDYRVRYYYPHIMSNEEQELIERYFNADGFVKGSLASLLPFFNEAQFLDHIVIRPEVKELLNNYFEDKSIEAIRKQYVPDFDIINADLYNYQKEGVTFATTRKHAIIADEMGLGKTIQAIATAVLKKDLFGFTKTLVVCPASLKEQWKKEIEKFTTETAEIIQGTPDERKLIYQTSSAFFLIVNYETVLRDHVAINTSNIDFLILDEAQKVKNYATKSAAAIKKIDRKHVLIITGTPIENKLIDLYSIMSILDPHLLGPLWEFSYKHCLFDHYKPNKINAYYNLTDLKRQLEDILLRREKRKVIEQLPNVQQHNIPVPISPLQTDFHSSYASGIGKITNKKFLTPYDLQRLQQLLTGMRMVCDSTHLVDENTYDSPKLEELKYILLEKLNLANEKRKVIIFSEWVKMNKLIGKMLLQNDIGYTELNGKVPVKKRGEIIKQFEENDDCQIFLSTEAGGTGLNLQMADVVINFELPWNPAKKNQRIGRIDRLGQKSKQLTVFNFITNRSIEERIALGLLVKQNLFDSVLDEDNTNDFVDFTEKGRGQFLEQMKELAGEFNSEKEYEKANDELREYSLDDFKTEHADEYKIPFDEDDNFTAETVDNEETKPNNEPIADDVNESSSEHTQSEEKGNNSEHTAEQMEEVLSNGMQFLSGLMKMATGKESGIQDQTITVDKETGEVTMKFKLPTF